jgi:hypothetical protein
MLSVLSSTFIPVQYKAGAIRHSMANHRGPNSVFHQSVLHREVIQMELLLQKVWESRWMGIWHFFGEIILTMQTSCQTFDTYLEYRDIRFMTRAPRGLS